MGRVLGIGRTKVFWLIREDKLESVQIASWLRGRRTVEARHDSVLPTHRPGSTKA